MSLIANEKTKLSAAFLNGCAIASVAAGAIAPLAAFSYHLPSSAPLGVVALYGIGWLVGGGVLYFIARQLLRGLRE